MAYRPVYWDFKFMTSFHAKPLSLVLRFFCIFYEHRLQPARLTRGSNRLFVCYFKWDSLLSICRDIRPFCLRLLLDFHIGFFIFFFYFRVWSPIERLDDPRFRPRRWRTFSWKWNSIGEVNISLFTRHFIFPLWRSSSDISGQILYSISPVRATTVRLFLNQFWETEIFVPIAWKWKGCHHSSISSIVH